VRIDKVQPEVEYVLRLSYTDLHDLYHMMLNFHRKPECNLTYAEQEFFQALREHA
jgi:DUF971 family protein